ncbi:MAG TPA: translocation/assembly module TamB domain-containing protein [Longimicrobiales bacterium]|nr:translocation/assembly module TamB domain-containing protein [Longimicrobiales bacterium]
MDARLVSVIALGCACCACGEAVDERMPAVDDYSIAVPAPMHGSQGVPLERARFRVAAADVRYEADGVRVSIGRVGTVLDGGRAMDLDLFAVEAERSAGGRLEWRITTDVLRLRDLRLLGDTRRVTVPPARLVADLPGRPRMIGTLAGGATVDAAGTLRTRGTLDLGASALTFTGALAPSGRWDATLGMAPLALADAHAFADAVPAHGAARGTLTVSGGGSGGLRARSRDLALLTDRSELRMTGAASRAGSGRWSFDSVSIALDPVHPEDWRAWLGSEPLVDAPVRGRLLAHGSGRDGIAVDGWVLADDGAGSRLAADVAGTLWLEPDPRLDLSIEARALRLAGTGPLDLDLTLSGDADSLAIVGRTRLVRLEESDESLHPLLERLPHDIADRFGSAELRIDASLLRAGGARRVVGAAEIVDSAGRSLISLRGYAPLAGDGPVDLTVSADSLPLTLLPVPAQVRHLEGYARAHARATGSVAAPTLVADAELVALRFDVPEFGTGVDSMRARVRLAGERIELVDVRAFQDGGSLALAGGVRLAAPPNLRDPTAAFRGATLHVTAVLDTMTVVDLDSARAVVDGHLAVTGPLQRPHVEGRIDIVDGRVFEGKLAPNPPLDPEDPPYAALAADAPWPGGRVAAAATRREEAAARREVGDEDRAAPPLTAEVTVSVVPRFRVIDEDSDLGALGAIHVVIDERGAHALGDARIVDGFYAYYGELFQLVGGAFAVAGSTTRLAMSGILRSADRPLGLGQGGYDGLDRRDPPIGIFGYSTPATVLELLRRRTPLPASQPELASLLLFDVPVQPLDGWDQELMWRGDEPDDVVGHRSAIQGSGLLWSFVADELYDYVPLDAGYLRAGTVRIGSRYPGWIMLGTQLEAAVHVGPRLTARAVHVVGGEAWPGVGVRFALREDALQPADRHVELFNEPRFSTSLGTSGPRADFGSRRRTGVRLRWLWDY